MTRILRSTADQNMVPLMKHGVPDISGVLTLIPQLLQERLRIKWNVRKKNMSVPDTKKWESKPLFFKFESLCFKRQREVVQCIRVKPELGGALLDRHLKKKRLLIFNEACLRFPFLMSLFSHHQASLSHVLDEQHEGLCFQSL